ncbi:MAG: hypothetical protein K2W82_09765 [Candidatus Obscuribacterales bacterium]|nr:hypothetical protein [Candidatus Obscuribacterales bacterium]
MVEFNRTFANHTQRMVNAESKQMPTFTLAKIRLASHPDASTQALCKLAKHVCPQVVIRVAENINTPVEILAILAKHSHFDVRIAVSENSRTPFLILLELIKDMDADVRFSLAENHNLPTTLLDVLAQDENPYVAFRAKKTLERIRTARSKGHVWFPKLWYQNRKRETG